MSLELHCRTFEAGETIPTKYTCKGKNLSPPLSWRGVPQGTQSLAILVDDPDAVGPNGPFTHWVLYGLPADLRELAEGFSSGSVEAPRGTEGRNSFGHDRYDGPCPPGGETHRYVFRLYALGKTPDLPPGANRTLLIQAIKNDVLDQSEYMGQYE